MIIELKWHGVEISKCGAFHQLWTNTWLNRGSWLNTSKQNRAKDSTAGTPRISSRVFSRPGSCYAKVWQTGRHDNLKLPYERTELRKCTTKQSAADHAKGCVEGVMMLSCVHGLGCSAIRFHGCQDSWLCQHERHKRQVKHAAVTGKQSVVGVFAALAKLYRSWLCQQVVFSCRRYTAAQGFLKADCVNMDCKKL